MRYPINKYAHLKGGETIINLTNPIKTEVSCCKDIKEKIPVNHMKGLYKIDFKNAAREILLLKSKYQLHSDYIDYNTSVLYKGRLGSID